MEELKENSNPSQPETKETQKSDKKKMEFPRKKRVIIYFVAVLVILLLTNPSVIPFMPESVAVPLQEFMTETFGDMNAVTEMIKLNWSVLFQLVFMAVILLLLRELCSWLTEKYQPKTPRAATMKNLFTSAMKYIFAFVAIFWSLSINQCKRHISHRIVLHLLFYFHLKSYGFLQLHHFLWQQPYR